MDTTLTTAVSVSAARLERFYRTEFDPNCIYLFFADELSSIIKLRKPLVERGELPEHLSLQEMVCYWADKGVVSINKTELPIGEKELSPTDNVFMLAMSIYDDYSFISHMHSADADKLGSDVIMSISEMGHRLVWMDLCSMCQECFPGDQIFNYDEHTRPTVLRLHIIIQYASEGCVCLNISTSSNPDPLDVHSLFRDELGCRMRKILTLLSSSFAASNKPVKSVVSPEPIPGNANGPIIIDDDVWSSAKLSHRSDFAVLKALTRQMISIDSIASMRFERLHERGVNISICVLNISLLRG